MNIIEAIKSGRRFRRISWKTNEWILQDRCDLPVRLSRDDIVADDWEIESKPVMITREKLEQAWEESFGWNEPYGALSFKCLAEELGL